MTPRTILFCLVVTFSLTAFASEKPAPDVAAATQLKALQAQSALTAPEKRVVDSMLDAGFALQATRAQKGTDVTVSPFSLSSAFGLVLNGVRGDTLAEVSGKLFGGLSADDFNTGYAALSQRLSKVSAENTLSFGNALFLDRDFAVLPEYTARVGRSLGARATALNFRNEQETVAAINSYIEEQTKQMIRNMITKAPERAALVNAGYFKGEWAIRFDSDRTRGDADFDTGLVKKPVPLMIQQGKTYLYYRGDGFQMASLAYKNGDFAMDLIVPDRTSDVRAAAAAVQAKLTGANYRAWIAAAAPRPINLALPRFETSYKGELTPYYRQHLPLVFSALADFGALTRERVAISDVAHATKLKVNEEGTEGAFATVISVKTTSTGPLLPEVLADRPFLFVIRHTATGTPIFVGSVGDPQPITP